MATWADSHRAGTKQWGLRSPHHRLGPESCPPVLPPRSQLSGFQDGDDSAPLGACIPLQADDDNVSTAPAKPDPRRGSALSGCALRGKRRWHADRQGNKRAASANGPSGRGHRARPASTPQRETRSHLTAAPSAPCWQMRLRVTLSVLLRDPCRFRDRTAAPEGQ